MRNLSRVACDLGVKGRHASGRRPFVLMKPFVGDACSASCVKCLYLRTILDNQVQPAVTKRGRDGSPYTLAQFLLKSYGSEKLFLSENFPNICCPLTLTERMVGCKRPLGCEDSVLS